MNYTYYNIKRGEFFYASSSKPKDGYEQHKYVDMETAEEKVAYWKKAKKLEGKLKWKEMKKTPFGSTIFSLTLEEDADNCAVINITVLDSKFRVTGYAKSLATIVDSLENGKNYSVSIGNKKNDKGILYENLYFRCDEELVKSSFEAFGANSIIPKGVQKKHPVTGDTVWDFSEHDKFLYDILKKFERSSKSEDSQTTESPKNEPKRENKETKREEPTLVSSATDDELPF